MLCSDYEKRDHRISTVVDFDANARLPEWETKGKKWLAERITEVLVMDNVLGVKVDKKGVHAIQDLDDSFNQDSDDWEPNLVFTPHKPSAFKGKKLCLYLKKERSAKKIISLQNIIHKLEAQLEEASSSSDYEAQLTAFKQRACYFC